MALSSTIARIPTPCVKAPSSFRDRNPWESWSRLMAETQGGDKESYRRLLNEIGPLLLNFVRKRVFNQDLVEDAYQEVMLTLHKVRHTYDSSRPLGPWLFTVARHSILSTLAKNRKFAEMEFPMEILPDVAPRESDQGLEDDLFKALEKVPEIHRKAVKLLKINGFSLQEAAGELGITVAALKVRAHRGYVFLRKHLALMESAAEKN